MSVATIKAAYKELLLAGTELKYVDEQYPRPSQRGKYEDYPRAVTFRKRGRERRTAAGGEAPAIGYKAAVWQVTIHVMGLYPLPLNEDGLRADWDGLVESVYDVLRSAPMLNGLADREGKSKVMRAEDFDEETPMPPITTNQNIAFNTFITVSVEEWIRA